jgi:hypothetical protein
MSHTSAASRGGTYPRGVYGKRARIEVHEAKVKDEQDQNDVNKTLKVLIHEYQWISIGEDVSTSLLIP